MKKIVVILLSLILAMSLNVCAVAEPVVLSYESRGVQIPATVVVPDGVESYPLVVLIHGHGGSREENVGFAVVADALAAQGIATVRMDFPGCGESTESFQMNCQSNMKADVVAAIEYMKANYRVTKIGLFGYSMGGRIALEMVAEGATPDAICLLAPATQAGNQILGDADSFEEMRAVAEKEGFIVYTTIYGQVQELSKQFFEDLLLYEDVASAAKEKYSGPVSVIWATDDEVISAETIEHVKAVFNVEVIDATGEGHGYGFYSEGDAVRKHVAQSAADFFANHLK